LSFILVDHSRLAFAKVSSFFDDEQPAIRIHPSAPIDVSANIRSFVRIGGSGFGSLVNENGIPIRISHFGYVKIGKDVEIGLTVVIARDTFDETIIGDVAKIVDHVFIAHSVEIGAPTLIIAGAKISDCVVIGVDCWNSPLSTGMDKISIADRSTVGLEAIVIENVPQEPFSTAMQLE